MLVALWTVDLLLALTFAATGLLKLVRTTDQLLAAGMGWVEAFAAAQVRLLGLAELLGAAGLVLPLATGIAPVLSPVAALALGALTSGATAVHLRRRDGRAAPAVVALVLCLVSAMLGLLVTR